VKLLVREEGSDEAEALWIRADSLVSCRALYVEARAAIEGARRAGRLSKRATERVVEELELRFAKLYLVELRSPLARDAGELAERHRLHALDAIHLASALGFADPRLVVASWDHELRRAVQEAGLGLAPAHG
jgi:predicted nucleic acid-binding protein